MFQARNVSIRRNKRNVVQNVDLDLQPGEVLALCGPNGAGKSTLLSAFAGDSPVASGKVVLDGKDLIDLSVKDLAMQRAVLEQSPSLSASFTVDELTRLSIPLELTPADTERTVNSVLQQLDLYNLRHKTVYELSGGQQHRTHLARTLCQLEAGRQLGGGQYLLLDEPTASLDIAFQITVMEAAHRAAQNGVGVLVVLHDLNLAAAYCDYIAIMKSGKLCSIGKPVDVLTADNLSEIYGTPIRVENIDGRLSVLPSFSPLPMAAE